MMELSLFQAHAAASNVLPVSKYGSSYMYGADGEEAFASQNKRPFDEHQHWALSQDLKLGTPSPHSGSEYITQLHEAHIPITWEQHHQQQKRQNLHYDNSSGVIFPPTDDKINGSYGSAAGIKEANLRPSESWPQHYNATNQEQHVGAKGETDIKTLFPAKRDSAGASVSGHGDEWAKSRGRNAPEGVAIERLGGLASSMEEQQGGAAATAGGGGAHGGTNNNNNKSNTNTDELFSDVADPVLRRRLQNREASARFRARGKVRDQQLNQLRDEVEMLTRKNQQLQEELEAMKAGRQADVMKIQENTMLWIMSKFRLKRKISFRAVVHTVTRTMALHRAVTSPRHKDKMPAYQGASPHSGSPFGNSARTFFSHAISSRADSQEGNSPVCASSHLAHSHSSSGLQDDQEVDMS